MTDLIMYDTTTIDAVPPNPVAVAGYTSGRWPTYLPLVKKFPKAKHVAFNITSGLNGDDLDCEPGDVPPTAFEEIAEWIRRQNTRTDPQNTALPGIYTSLSNAQAIVDALTHRGLRYGIDYFFHTAHYTFRQHRCSPACGFGWRQVAHATQFTDKALGRNLDASAVDPAVFKTKPAPPPDPYRIFYDKWLACRDVRTGRRVVLNEKRTVIEFDKAIVHPVADPARTIGLWYELVALRKRVWHQAHTYKDSHGHLPSWDADRRGARWQALNHRTEGLN